MSRCQQGWSLLKAMVGGAPTPCLSPASRCHQQAWALLVLCRHVVFLPHLCGLESRARLVNPGYPT